MTFVKFIITGILFSVFISCNSTENKLQEEVKNETVVIDEKSPVTYSQEEKEAVVNKGGPKADEQLILEDLLAKLKTNLEINKGTQFAIILGHWVGEFGKNKINITLTSIDEKEGTVDGYSVCAGNFRRLNGTYNFSDNLYSFVLNEPGDDQYDGKFEFSLKKDAQNIDGSWAPFKEKGNTSKKYSLNRRDFSYDEKNGSYEASSRLLEESDVQNQALDDLRLMRNEIYARHGYCFKDKDMRYHFEQEEWYMPMGVDIRHELTDIEIENISLIYEYEDYYMDYSDEYGR